MGRKTYDSIGKPLDRRDNIVAHPSAGLFRAGHPCRFHHPGGARRSGARSPLQRGAEEIAVIGGAEVFRAALPFAERVYLTLVHATPAGDVALPPFDPTQWRETAREPMQQAAGDQYAADFVVLNRQR